MDDDDQISLSGSIFYDNILDELEKGQLVVTVTDQGDELTNTQKKDI